MAKPLSRKAALAMGALAVYLNPKMAQDAKVDLGAMLKGVTAKNWKSQKPKLKVALDAAVVGKLAKDADIEDVVEMLDQLDDVAEEVADEIAAAPVVKPEEKPAEDDDPAMLGRIREFLKGKLSEEDMAALETMMKPEVVAAAEDEEKPVVEKKIEKDDKVTKAAMDAAIATAVEAATSAATTRQRDIREAEKAVRPYVGDIVIACDSAEDVYHAALKMRGIKTDGVHPSAFRTILEMQPKAGAVQPKIALDRATGDGGYAERFPETKRLAVI